MWMQFDFLYSILNMYFLVFFRFVFVFLLNLFISFFIVRVDQVGFNVFLWFSGISLYLVWSLELFWNYNMVLQ